MQALEINQLTKTYKNGFQALKGVDLTVSEGDFFSLLGPNGAGKSTLINNVVTLVKKTSGGIKVYGHDVDTELNAAKACIGLVPQEFNLAFFEKSYSILVQVAGFYGVPRKEAKIRAEKYLKALDLWGKRDQQARTLSGGMKRRLMIARALMNQPKLLILDEPTAGVDIEIRRSMWGFLQDINRNGTTIILTTHYLEEAENLCKNVAMINHGKVIRRGSMREFIDDLNIQTYIFDLENALLEAPKLAPFTSRLIEPKIIEVDLMTEQHLNDLFNILAVRNIQVNSVRNKSNRLEEIFIRLAQKGDDDAE